MKKTLDGAIATDLFSPLWLGPYALPNRTVMAPLTCSRADDDDMPSDMAAVDGTCTCNAPNMIELVITRCSTDSAELEISCADGGPDDQLLRFIRAKVSVENLLPMHAIVSSSRHIDTGIAHLAWRVQWQQLAHHIALIRATFAVAGLNYVYSARRPVDVPTDRRRP